MVSGRFAAVLGVRRRYVSHVRIVEEAVPSGKSCKVRLDARTRRILLRMDWNRRTRQVITNKLLPDTQIGPIGANNRSLEETVGWPRTMPGKKVVCFAVLLLIVASFSLVAADLCLSTWGEHELGRCPVDAWAHGLAMDLPSADVIWLVQVAFCESSEAFSFCTGSSRWPFAPRAPPAGVPPRCALSETV